MARWKASVALLAVAALGASACGSSSKSSSGGSSTTASASGNKASAPGVTASAIKIGFITSLTGAASSTFATAPLGAEAYFDALNEAGGIDGRKVQLISVDDTSSPAGALTATNVLIHDGVYGIVVDSSYFFGAYRVAQQAGIPVTGSAFDGPEWGEQPNTNMFSTLGGVDPNHSELQAALGAAALAKYLGVKNVGGLAYGISPSSISSIKDTKTALQDAGLQMGYENLSVTFGTTDVSTPVLAMKNAGVDFALCSCVQSTVLAMVSGLKQSGSDAKSLSYASADSTLFADPSAAAASQNVYYSSAIPPFGAANDAASNTFAANIKAVEPSYETGQYPTFGITDAYLGAALMAEGLKVAGQNPTRQSFITNLTKVTGWDADGLLASPVSFDHFGTSDKSYCDWFVQATTNSFVPVNGGKAFCTNVPSNLS